MIDSQGRLRQLIDDEREWLRSTVPPDRWATIAALTRAYDRLLLVTGGLPAVSTAPVTPAEPLVLKRDLYRLGWNTALALCLTARTSVLDPEDGLDDAALDEWADQMLAGCGRLGEAEQVLARCESGYLALQLQDSSGDTFAAWAKTRRMPPEWRERYDFAWWSTALAREHEPERQALPRSRPQAAGSLAMAGGRLLGERHTSEFAADGYYQQLARLEVRRMACQHSYPAGAAIGGAPFRLYADVLAWLIGWMLPAIDQDATSAGSGVAASVLEPLGAVRSEPALVNALVVALGVDTALARHALDCYTLDRENAAYHAALPGAAPPPCIRVDDEHLVCSAAGLLTEPFVFLTRELRRRHAHDYHNTAHLREDVFREDLYRLFGDKRFVKSAGRVELKREGGSARTDLDAVIFDRKTGTLGIFELKAQDPFARTTLERLRQRDNFYRANDQVAVALHWLRQHGPNTLLTRIDAKTAKTFQAQRVHLFVLGRYLAHFADGPEPDRRAAWGTWPQVLQLSSERPYSLSDANPLSALYNGLVKARPLDAPDNEQRVRAIVLGTARIRVYSSFAHYHDDYHDDSGQQC